MTTRKSRITLEEWIKEALADPDKGAPCSGLALVHLKQGLGTEEVHTKEMSGTSISVAQLAEFFQNKACYFAQDMPGLQSFRLQAFYGSNEPKASHTFTVFEGNMTGGELVPWSKHEPTPQGLLAQLMKHNEALSGDMRLTTQGMIGMLMQSFVEHNKEKAEMHGILRDVLLNLRKEEHAMRMEQLRFQRESEERQMLGRLAPSFVNYLTGKEVISENHADSQLIEQFALKVEPQHLQMMIGMGLVTNEQAMLLANRFTKIREEHTKRQQVLVTVPPEDSNGQSKPA